mgnify:CR=1 FL=1
MIKKEISYVLKQHMEQNKPQIGSWEDIEHSHLMCNRADNRRIDGR